MKLQGSFDIMPLSDLIQWIGTSKKTGKLELSHRRLKKSIYFDSGMVVLTGTSNSKEYLGTYLVERRIITEAQLNEAVSKQNTKAETLAFHLVDKGCLDDETMTKVLHEKMAEDVYDTFLWDSGRFVFSKEKLPEKEIIPVELNSMSLVMEGVRRLDEWHRIRAAFPNDTVVLKVSESPNVFENVELDIEAGTMLPIIDGEKTIDTLFREHAGTKFEVFSMLFDLYRQGVLEIAEVGDEETEEERANDMIEAVKKAVSEDRYVDALNLVDDGIKRYGDNREIRSLHTSVLSGFKKNVYENHFTSDDVPFLWVAYDRIDELDLDHNEAFLISRIAGGNNSVRDLLNLSPMDEVETLRILKRLSETKIIGFKAGL